MFSHQVKSTDMQNILMKILFKLAEEKKKKQKQLLKPMQLCVCINLNMFFHFCWQNQK